MAPQRSSVVVMDPFWRFGLVCNPSGPLVLTGNLLYLIKEVDYFWAAGHEVL